MSALKADIFFEETGHFYLGRTPRLRIRGFMLNKEIFFDNIVQLYKI